MPAESKKRSRSLSVESRHSASKAKRQHVGSDGEDEDAPVLYLPVRAMSSSTASIDSRSSSSTAVSTFPPTPRSAATSIVSTSNNSDVGSSSSSPPPSTAISLRCLIVSQDASIIIGKGGSHVTEIRDTSGAKVAVSEHIMANPERVLTVSGQLESVAQAYGLIVKRINDEPMNAPSLPGARFVTVKLLIPHAMMGSVIGRAGTKVKEIQDASGARVVASDSVVHGGEDRILNVTGVADSIHIAAFHVGRVLLDMEAKKEGGAAARMPMRTVSHAATTTLRSVPRAQYPVPQPQQHAPFHQQLQHNPYAFVQHQPPQQPAGWGLPPAPPQPQYNFHPPAQHFHQPYPSHSGYPQRAPPYPHPALPVQQHFHQTPHHQPPFRPHPQQYPHPYQHTPTPHHHPAATLPVVASAASAAATVVPALNEFSEQLFVANDLVGSIIGKGGSKINEVRQMSGAQVKIKDIGVSVEGRQPVAGERMIAISGGEANVKLAVALILQRIEQEKRRIQSAGPAVVPR